MGYVVLIAVIIILLVWGWNIIGGVLQGIMQILGGLGNLGCAGLSGGIALIGIAIFLIVISFKSCFS